MTIPVRIIDRPAFTIAGQQTYISGPDNEQFGRFWEQSRADGLLDTLRQLQQETGMFPGPRTNSAVLGVSRVEKDPNKRDFYYMIAVESAAPVSQAAPQGLIYYEVPAARWAVFECRGKIPEALVAAEMYAFMEWLPKSGYRHAPAPDMEVYPPRDDPEYMEFWLPVETA